MICGRFKYTYNISNTIHNCEYLNIENIKIRPATTQKIKSATRIITDFENFGANFEEQLRHCGFFF
jgi:hypothetical protein